MLEHIDCPSEYRNVTDSNPGRGTSEYDNSVYPKGDNTYRVNQVGRIHRF